MNLENILAINTSPVDEEIICGINRVAPYCTISYLSMENWVRFILFYRYIEKFIISMEVSVSLPDINYCLSKKDKNVEVEKYIAGWQSGDFARGLFTRVMAECRWQCRAVSYNGKSWIRTPETGVCKSAEWKSVVKLARKMKKTLKPNRRDTRYHIFWNYHLAWYLQFRQRNPRKVQSVFSEGDKKIEELLEKIGNPLCIKVEEDLFMLDAGKYLLGLMEGWSGQQRMDFQMMDYLFLIRIIVLDKLLKCAKELFEMVREEKYDT